MGFHQTARTGANHGRVSPAMPGCWRSIQLTYGCISHPPSRTDPCGDTDSTIIKRASTKPPDSYSSLCGDALLSPWNCLRGGYAKICNASVAIGEAAILLSSNAFLQLAKPWQDCLDVFDGPVCTHWGGRHAVGAVTKRSRRIRPIVSTISIPATRPG